MPGFGFLFFAGIVPGFGFLLGRCAGFVPVFVVVLVVGRIDP